MSNNDEPYESIETRGTYTDKLDEMPGKIGTIPKFEEERGSTKVVEVGK